MIYELIFFMAPITDWITDHVRHEIIHYINLYDILLLAA